MRKPLDVVGESSFEAAVFKGPAKPLGALSGGAAEPLDAILWGLAEPLEAVFGGSAEPLSVSEDHARNSGVGRYRPRLPGGSLSAGRYRSGSARRTHIRLSRPKWTF